MTFGDAYTDTRLQLHALAQIPAALGLAHADKHPLWQHGALRWSDEHDALVSAPAPGGQRAALRPRDGAILFIGDDVKEWSSAGQTMQAGMAWLQAQLTRHGMPEPIAARAREKMPEHAVSDGAPFAIDPASAGTLHGIYKHADAALADWRGRFGDAEPVLVWPHHFDISFMRVLRWGKRDDAEDAVTISFGMSPGDPTSSEPYGYVTFWPTPDPMPALPDLPAGRWHTDGWLGSLLPASENDGRDTLFAWMEASNQAGEALLAAAPAATK